MNLDDATNPVAADDTDTSTVADDTGVDNESQSDDNEPELDDDGNPIDPPEESEEIEHDGKKYALPKALKPLLLMQADYTRKTQEVAKEREAVQAERQALHQSSQAELDTYAAAKSMEGQLAQYERIDWDAWHEQDPFSASAATSKYQVLQRQYNQAMGHLQNLRTQRTLQQQQETAKREEEGRAALAKDIPGWNDDLKAKLIGFAAGYGFSRSELDDLEADPRVAKVLHAAFTGSQTSQTARKVQNHVAAQAVQPAATVRARSAPPTGLDDRLTPDEWVRRRNAQLRKARG